MIYIHFPHLCQLYIISIFISLNFFSSCGKSDKKKNRISLQDLSMLSTQLISVQQLRELLEVPPPKKELEKLGQNWTKERKEVKHTLLLLRSRWQKHKKWKKKFLKLVATHHIQVIMILIGFMYLQKMFIFFPD